MSNPTTLAPENVRLSNSDSGSIGSRAWRSVKMNAAATGKHAISGTSTIGEPKPRDPLSIKPNVNSVKATIPSTCPGGSNPVPVRSPA